MDYSSSFLAMDDRPNLDRVRAWGCGGAVQFGLDEARQPRPDEREPPPNDRLFFSHHVLVTISVIVRPTAPTSLAPPCWPVAQAPGLFPTM